MAKVTFIIKKDYKSKTGECPILLEYNHVKTRFRFNTKLKVDPTIIEIFYDHDEELFKVRSLKKSNLIKKDYLARINSTLLELQKRIQVIISDQKVKAETLTASIIKLKFEKPQVVISAKPKQDQPIALIDWYESFIEEKSSKISEGLKSYKSTLTHLKHFVNKDVVLLSDLKKDFFEKFQESLESKELLGSTIFKQFKNLRICLNWIKSKDEDDLIKIPQTYKTYKIKARFADPIGLSIEQFNELIAIDLTNRPHLEQTRDLFVFGVAMGGLRHGDLCELAKYIRLSDGYSGTMTFFELKTGNEHHEVPLNDLAQSIINKYPIFPTVPCNQIMNRHLKSIGRLLNWNMLKIVPEYDAGGRVVRRNMIALKDLFSTKFMRKTSATIDGELEIEPHTSMQRSGHKSLPCYLRYRGTSKENFIRVNNKWKFRAN